MKKDRDPLLNFFIGVMGMVLNIACFLATVYFIYYFAVWGFNNGREFLSDALAPKESKEIEVTLPDKASVGQAAKILQERGVIKSALFYQLDVVLTSSRSPYKGGTYVLNTSMDSNQINTALRSVVVKANDIKIQILEGYNTNDIAEYLESKGIVKKQDFIDACNNGVFDYAFLNDVPKRENRLEGYLFPDTYFILPDSTPEKIIHKMLTRFEEIYGDEYSAQAAALKLTMDEVVTMASIIEKEVRIPEERANVAEIMNNRLRIKMPLQMCSTIIYILNKKRSFITEEDLKIKSPYNTYLNAGLPPGPIANPGEDAIKAVLSPNKGDLLYFVLKDENTGEHFFTGSYDAFVKAKAEYKQNY